MEIVDNIVVKFQCPSETALLIRKSIPKSEIISDTADIADVVVFYGLREMQQLAHIAPLAIKVPSPIDRDYNWPGMYKPFDHQRDTARFLTLFQRAFCFNEAGTGKTSAAIWAADYLMNQKIVKRVFLLQSVHPMRKAEF